MSALGEFVAELLNGYDAAQAEELKISQENEDAIGAFAARQAIKLLGIDIDLDGEVSEQSITRAINTSILGGQFEFRNLFDREAVKADVRRIAIMKAAEVYGFDGSTGIQGLKEKILADVHSQVRDEIEAGQGDYMAAAPDSAIALSVLEKPKNESYNTPRDFSAKGVSNRARQAKFRANNSRVWVPK
jgi:hypothetical protein